MSLLIRGDGHLDILMLYEQHRPRLRNRRVSFICCYDVILRSYSEKPLAFIYILSQYAAGSRAGHVQPVFDLLDRTDTDCFDWVYEKREQISGSESFYKLSFPSGTLDVDSSTLVVNKLHPVIKPPSWMQQPAYAKAAAALWIAGFTFAEIHFENQEEILPYDPDDPRKTTYWLRLCIEPETSYDIEKPLSFGLMAEPLLGLQPCTILGSQTLVDHLNDNIECLVQDNRDLAADAQQAKEFVFASTFDKEGTSTAILDHRISLVTTGRFLVLNPRHDGLCGFIDIEGVDKQTNTLARTWITGADHYWETDPLELAWQVYLYLREWAFNQTEAKTKEQVSTAVLPEEHANICYVIEALKAVEYVREVNGGARYCVVGKNLDEALSILCRQRTAGAKAHWDAYVHTRDILYGKLPQPAAKEGSARFIPKGFRIQFELGFALK